jgi:hypothetical protein
MSQEEGMDAALDAIYEEAEKLLGRDDLPEDAQQAVGRILALARYKFPVTSKGKVSDQP